MGLRPSEGSRRNFLGDRTKLPLTLSRAAARKPASEKSSNIASVDILFRRRITKKSIPHQSSDIATEREETRIKEDGLELGVLETT